MSDAELKSRVDTLIKKLPPDGQKELIEYLDFLADKYQVAERRNILILGGVWKHSPLDVSDEELRRLREDTSKRIMKKFENGLSS